MISVGCRLSLHCSMMHGNNLLRTSVRGCMFDLAHWDAACIRPSPTDQQTPAFDACPECCRVDAIFVDQAARHLGLHLVVLNHGVLAHYPLDDRDRRHIIASKRHPRTVFLAFPSQDASGHFEPLVRIGAGELLFHSIFEDTCLLHQCGKHSAVSWFSAYFALSEL